jgi:hypothetical protein
VASTKCTDRFLVGSEPEYDEEDDWGGVGVCPALKLGARSPSFCCCLREAVPDAMCEHVPPCVVMIIINVNLLFVL